MTGSRSPVALLGALAGAAAVIGLIAAGAGNRLGWWDYWTGFDLLRWSAWGGVAAAIIGLAGCFHATRPGRRGLALAAIGLVASVIALALPQAALLEARRHPPIHDITTDTANPPRFVAVLPLRAAAANPATYGGPRIAALQRKAYPDIGPLTSARPTGALFQASLDAARALHWTIVAADRASGRIEASARTFWFGFTDDVVIRVAAAGTGRSRLDIRSVSRVGRNDTGTNARRIRRFMEDVRARLGPG